MEVTMSGYAGGLYEKPQIRGKNQFYYVPDGDGWIVMRRFKSVPDKPVKTYKTRRGASSHAFFRNGI